MTVRPAEFPETFVIDSDRTSGSTIIAKNQNTFLKRQREMEKRRKAEEKRQRRLDRKVSGTTTSPLEETNEGDQEVSDQTPLDQGNVG